ncbi:type 1 fimbrial major subunit FimA [Scandinavium sp. V105_16]|uniref:Type 1 fimbrial major subunit FimA n=2 Tax=Scandinavium lactucae TaxID=3095028 RepID=A0AAJ2S171_9ENTR|nr:MULTISPECIES: type 1 fimbrial major subunit FimA [unclassified Scandinavium]MDX6020479.1 type 1 fimbrial major subunit FimA [Scandinavium sp. V105_16]MDX6031969.1 type 1 fimbrial major subunit FimA [Scandinavium sp. V105_12]MDX6039833.1 type 1 fimbrial major subunit FimA [Scandinavium sp. V105_6]MDX6051434.1 type 1 fimbrial major subunit FimA [Scandinavium sp. V105_1]
MSFKMKALSVALIATASFASAGAFAAASSTTVAGGTVHFTGEVVDAACVVDTGSQEQTVELGQVKMADLAAAGDIANTKQFNITLDDCSTTAASTAAVSFNGTVDATDPTALAVSSITTPGNAATNVGIQILSDSKVITPNGGETSSPITLVDGTNVLPFNAQFVATGGAATAGAADADATFNITYN